MEEVVRYTYRLRPGRQAERALLAEWGRCRWLWNEAVHQQRAGRLIGKRRMGHLLTEARAASSWLREGWQNSQAETLNTYCESFVHSLKVKGRGRPRHKRLKVALPSLPFTRRGFSVRDGCLHLPKGTRVPVVWSRKLPSDPTSCRVYRDSLGHWYVSFVVRREATPAVAAGGRIGIDWGVKATATTTNPTYDLPHLGYRRRCAADLAKAQRKMARRRRPKGSASSIGYQKARRAVAVLYKKAARQNTYAARVWAKRLVADHELIAVEDFRPRFLAKSTMARKAADAAIGTTKSELIRCAARAGRKVVLVPPAYTTMTCAECGTRAKERLTLAERIFTCTACGSICDRDVNAARVILAVAERGHASADDVRRSIPTPRGGDRVQSELGILSA